MFIIVAISAVSQVGAADLNATDDAIGEDVISVDESQKDADNDVLSVSEEYAPKNYNELKETVLTAEEGSTIKLNGTYEFNEIITIKKALNIEGVGDGAVIKYDDFVIKKTGLFEINSSNVVLSNLQFVESIGQSGGAVCWNGDDGVISNCTFSHNTANAEGGALVIFGDNCSVTDCSFKNNKAEDIGGAVSCYGDNGRIINCEFIENEVRGDNGSAGALLLKAQDCIVENCTFINNHAANYGGAIATSNKKNSITNCIFKGNHVENNFTGKQGGGAIFSECEDLTIDNCSFSGNLARNSLGGAIVLGSHNIIKNSFFDANYALVGNDIYLDSVSFIFRNSFILDYAESKQEAIYDYDLACKYSDDTTNNYTITKIDSTISFISTGMVFDYGSYGVIFVKVEGGSVELGNIRVLDHPEATITFVNNVLTVSGLDVGKYILRVTTTPDENHYSVDSDLTVTVNKATAVIKASKITVALKKGAYWNIKIVDSKTNKPISNMVVTLKVYTGSKYKTVYLVTNANGEASYQTKGLSKGTHKVVVSASHSGYVFNTLTSSIKVIKPKALTFKIQKRVNDKKGSLVSFIVMNKKTKKGINGVKVKLLLYTGKKYVTVNLKTKSVGKFKGAVGYSTNKLTVGKHKVKIIPSSIKYSGSKTTTMTIKKSAKKYPAWETKVSG